MEGLGKTTRNLRTERVGVAVTLWARIREVLGSNFGHMPAIMLKFFMGFLNFSK